MIMNDNDPCTPVKKLNHMETAKQLKNILFVEDELYLLESLGRLLREYRREWELHFAANAEEALLILAAHQVDLVITDIRMPGISGLELLARLQSGEETRKIPVVVLTGDQDRTLKRQALDLGAVDLLNKPINKEDLVSRIKNVLKLKEFQDIVIEKNLALEQQLVISQKMELVGVMAAGAIHDLSNLLSIIVGYSNFFIEENQLDSESAGAIERIRQAGEKASSVVGQILRFSRHEGGEEHIFIGAAVNEVLDILSVSIPRNIKLQRQLPARDIRVCFPSVKFQQVLMNLLINALQAIDKKEGKLKIVARAEEREQKAWVRLEVRDTGPGMEEGLLDRIFEPLFTTKPPGKGTGLGLFVVRRLVEEYGGFITVESVLGKGSAFSVHLPVLPSRSGLDGS